MEFLTDPQFWARWLGIVLIDLTLAGDNALVIALAVRTLPPRQQFLGRMYGTAGAVGLRLFFIVLVSFLFQIPLLQLVGGLVLIWIALKLVRQSGGEAEGHVRHGTTLREAVGVIIVADVIMSLDNVIGVAAAAHGDFLLVVFGIGLSIPLVVWGSGILAGLMNRHPWIIWLGGGVLGFVAGEMILKDPLAYSVLGGAADLLHYPLPIAIAFVLTILGWFFARRQGAEQVVEEAESIAHATDPDNDQTT